MLKRLGINRIDSRTLAAISIAAALLLALAWYLYWYQPAQLKIQELREEIRTLEVERRKGLAAKRRLPKLREEIANLEKEIEAFLAALPEEEKFYEVLDLLSKNAKETGVVLNSLSRSPSRSEIAQVGSIDVSMNLEGQFANLYAYLKRLENLKRYSSIDGVNLSATQTATPDPRLGASLTVRFYVYQGKKGGEGQ